MSIYATLFEIKVSVPQWSILFWKEEGGKKVAWVRYPDGHEEPYDESKDWVEVIGQGVPGHIGHPDAYPEGDPYADFLPPVVGGEDYENKFRAVVVVKGDEDEKDIQRYVRPLFVMTGEEYEKSSWQDLMTRIESALNERTRR